MNRFQPMTGEKCQERTIKITTYSAGPDKIIMEGTLIDHRFTENYLLTGEKRPVGDFHHMILRILIHMISRRIEDIDIELVKVPRDECAEVKSCFDSLKGEYIRKGFMRRMQSLVGGEKSCAHLRTLLTSMSPTVVQGIYSIHAQKPTDLHLLIDHPELKQAVLGTIHNTCFVWREDGQEIRRVLEMMDEKNKIMP